MAYQLAIIGAGVTGASLLHMVSRFTDINRIVLIEKNDRPGLANSNPLSNSQTLHQGDIESNYELDKALVLKYNATLIKQFARFQSRPILGHCHRLLLAVGEDEVDKLERRYHDFLSHYPNMLLWNKSDLLRQEPMVVNGRKGLRPDALKAIAVTNDASMVNYQHLASALIEDALAAKKEIDLYYKHQVRQIKKKLEHYVIDIGNKQIEADTVVVCGSGLSFSLAQEMGLTSGRWLLSVAGKFFTLPKKTNSKIYTMQDNALPFSAVHCDPCILSHDINRIGPTVAVSQNAKVMRLLWPYFKNKSTRAFMVKNALYQMPGMSKYFYLKQARKIIPSLTIQDLKEVQKGGLRPILLNDEDVSLSRPTQKLNSDHGLIFNIALSPGGVSCLANAVDDAESLCQYLGLSFHQETFNHVYDLD